MTTERLLGSYLIRVSQSGHERRVTVHSVLTGERRGVADFAELATYLDAVTAEAARSRGETEEARPEGLSAAGAGDTGAPAAGSDGHGR